MVMNRRVLVFVLACVSVSVALACGPEFPWQLLDNRAATLKAAPANSFDFEATRLATPPTDALAAKELPSFPPAPAPRSEAEMDGLSPEQIVVLEQSRAANDEQDAFAQGADLPMAVRLYIAGAVAFQHHDLERAVSRFDALLQLPEADQRLRATWATYMLGRSYVQGGDPEKAAEAFQRTRDFARKGFPDPLGLAVASYGEEARLHLQKANSYLVEDELPPDKAAEYASEIATATALYAEQAARGSRIGVNSLRVVAERQLRTEARLAAVITDPLVQRLLVAYVLARVSDLTVQVQTDNPEEYKVEKQLHPLVLTLVDTIAQQGVAHPVGADRLAALAYRSGRYDLAQQLAATASGPLAAWVKAKLALQQGDVTTAAAFYADAAKAFPTADHETTLDSPNTTLLTGETGVLALARGEYRAALEYLYPVASTYWGDVAHLAERVLIVDELKRFVDEQVPASAAPAPPPGTGQEEGYRSPAMWLWQPRPAAQLRDLLARRLVRAGRYQEALTYFHAADDPDFADPEISTHVSAYAEALQEAETRWRRIARAQAWYQAAVLARKFGMEMMGYEAAPDFFVVSGIFDFGAGQKTLTGQFITEAEQQRFFTSAAPSEARYHYRYRAIDHINRAADLLPPRSQAFAAVLCQATGWMMGTPGADKHVHELYRRYVRQGPYVAWAAHFGRRCPEPDFVAAAHFAYTQPWRDTRRVVRQHKWAAGFGVVALVATILLMLTRRRRTTTAKI
jgi:tetratricopeptide (TPR) repeat protein